MVFLSSEIVKEERKKGKRGEEDRRGGGGDMKRGKIGREDTRGGGEESRRGEESRGGGEESRRGEESRKGDDSRRGEEWVDTWRWRSPGECVNPNVRRQGGDQHGTGLEDVFDQDLDWKTKKTATIVRTKSLGHLENRLEMEERKTREKKQKKEAAGEALEIARRIAEGVTRRSSRRKTVAIRHSVRKKEKHSKETKLKKQPTGMGRIWQRTSRSCSVSRLFSVRRKARDDKVGDDKEEMKARREAGREAGETGLGRGERGRKEVGSTASLNRRRERTGHVCNQATKGTR